jgi:hypothetical protein
VVVEDMQQCPLLVRALLFPPKLNMVLVPYPQGPWYFPKELKTYIHKRICTQTLMVALFITAKTWKRSGCASKEE